MRRFVRKQLVGELALPAKDLLVERRVGIPRIVSADHCVHHNAKRPHIYRAPVALPPNHLRGDIRWRAAHCVQDGRAHGLARQPKVRDARTHLGECAPNINENVLRFEITVHNVSRVQKGDAVDKLPGNQAADELRARASAVHPPRNVRQKVLLCQIHHNIHRLLGLEHVPYGHHVRMRRKAAQYVDFPLHPLECARGCCVAMTTALFAHDFDGKLFTRRSRHADVHNSRSAKPAPVSKHVAPLAHRVEIGLVRRHSQYRLGLQCGEGVRACVRGDGRMAECATFTANHRHGVSVQCWPACRRPPGTKAISAHSCIQK
eukprot:Opistho-2@8077